MSITPTRKWLIITLSVVFAASSWAQNPEIDSLQKLVAKESGTKKVDALNALAFRQILVDFKLADATIEQALKISKKENYIKGLAEANIYKGISENLKGNKSNALQLLKEGISQAKKVGVYGTEGYALTQIGNIYRGIGKYDSALIWYNQSYGVLKDSLNPWQLSVLYRNMGRLYNLTSQPQEEFGYLMRAYAIRKKLRDKVLHTDILVLLSQWYLSQSKLGKAKEYIAMAEKLNIVETLPEIQKDIRYQKAIIFFNEAKYAEALTLLNEVNEFYLKAGNLTSYVKVTIDIADMLEELGNYDLSLKKCFEALKICKEKNIKNEEVRASLIIAWNYYDTQQTALAKQTIEQTLADAIQYKFTAEQAAADNLLGNILTDEKNYREALTHFTSALAIRKRLKNPRGIINILGNMSQVYKGMGQYEEGLDLLRKSIELSDSLQDQISATWNYMRMSSIYIKLKNYTKADQFLAKAEKGARLNAVVSTRNGKTLLTNLYEARRDILMGKGKFNEALTFSLRYEKLKDSLDASGVSDRILSLQAAFELEERTNELALLTKNKQVQEDQIKIQKGKIRQQQIVIAAILIGLILLGALAYLAYAYYKKTHKLNGALQEQNEEIQTQSEELSESNTSLLKLNRDLAEKQEEIQAQAEELTESNQSLTLLNMELAEKSEELAAQSEELKESNEVISSLNENLESKVTERTQSLEQAYKELDTFFYRSSHDFRRPLTTFMGLAEVAKITVKDANALDLFDKVKETAVHLDRMLIKLQSISDVGAEQFAIKTISLRAVFEDACHVYSQELVDTNMQVEIRVLTLHDIISYPAFLKIIAENLLENSIRFRNPERPKVLLEAVDHNGGVLLLIKDNGIGIDEIHISRVFEMFFRGSEHSKGNGLGLYIVKKAVEKMKGHITFESSYGQGTSVLIWLPLSLS